MVEVLSTFGERLRFARELRRLSRRELGHRAGLESPAHVGIIERTPNADVKSATAAKLASALDVSLDWLVTGGGETPAAKTGTEG